MDAATMLETLDVVDLTQPLGPHTPLWPGTPPLRAREESTLADDGCLVRTLTLPEHAGTHVDAPGHFAAGQCTVEGLSAQRLVVPAVVINIAEQCLADADRMVTVEDLSAHEAAHGMIPAGCAVLVHTGWDRHLDDPARYVGVGDVAAFPGVSESAARVLVQRGVVGIGIDTLSIDAGSATDYPVHARVTLPAGLWHLEGLVNLASVPARGAVVVVGAPPVVGASGITARVFALVSRGD
jgi:kynurenine formamidase